MAKLHFCPLVVTKTQTFEMKFLFKSKDQVISGPPRVEVLHGRFKIDQSNRRTCLKINQKMLITSLERKNCFRNEIKSSALFANKHWST